MRDLVSDAMVEKGARAMFSRVYPLLSWDEYRDEYELDDFRGHARVVLEAVAADIAAEAGERIALAIEAAAHRQRIEAERTQYTSHADRRNGLLDAASIARAGATDA